MQQINHYGVLPRQSRRILSRPATVKSSKFSIREEKLYRMGMREFLQLIAKESDLIAVLANTTAILNRSAKFFWVGFYLVKQKELILGPFQGTPACTRIAFGKGVCGTAAVKRQTIIVPDVHKFPGHIACDRRSCSEIVVPVFDTAKRLRAVLDVDSTLPNAFGNRDKNYLESITLMLRHKFKKKYT
ncbi:MAG: GAF domain-containing protein [bacterium]